MAATPPHHNLRKKDMIFYLNGDDTRFLIRLNDRIATTGRIFLSHFVLVGATGNLITFFFGPESNLKLVDTSSNVVQAGGFSIIHTTGASSTVYSPPRLIAACPNREVQEFSLSPRDRTGAEHNPTTNRLFDHCYLFFTVEEIQGPRTPDWLQQVPTIQQTMDTV